ncbi:MAG TPA: OmpA family protein [Chitinivibrionales bacterium]|nr:OmpA family protein [Chitinivibrionales bacterium]
MLRKKIKIVFQAIVIIAGGTLLMVGCVKIVSRQDSAAALNPPAAQKPALPPEKKIDLGVLYFDRDKTVLTPDALSRLYNVGHFLAANPGYRVIIEAYSDERDDNTYDSYLSEERAKSVYNWLVLYGAYQIEAKRVIVHTFGNSKPAQKNCGDDDTCHEKNRRVELTAITNG